MFVRGATGTIVTGSVDSSTQRHRDYHFDLFLSSTDQGANSAIVHETIEETQQRPAHLFQNRRSAYGFEKGEAKRSV